MTSAEKAYSDWLMIYALFNRITTFWVHVSTEVRHTGRNDSNQIVGKMHRNVADSPILWSPSFHTGYNVVAHWELIYHVCLSDPWYCVCVCVRDINLFSFFFVSGRTGIITEGAERCHCVILHYLSRPNKLHMVKSLTGKYVKLFWSELQAF